jgi:hypothetical protein
MSKTYMVYETGGTGDPKTRWTAIISNINTGQVEAVRYWPSENEGRQWAQDMLNKIAANARHSEALGISNDEALTAFNWDGGYVPPSTPKVEVPLIPIKCYICGKEVNAIQTHYTGSDEVAIEMRHCGRHERKVFTLPQALEVAKVGWLAFMS